MRKLHHYIVAQHTLTKQISRLSKLVPSFKFYYIEPRVKNSVPRLNYLYTGHFPSQLHPIPVQDSLISIPYPRRDCLKTSPFTAAYTRIAYIWGTPPGIQSRYEWSIDAVGLRAVFSCLLQKNQMQKHSNRKDAWKLEQRQGLLIHRWSNDWNGYNLF